MNKERRSQIRIDLISEFCLWSSANASIQTEDKITNFSTKGMFIESTTQPKPKEILDIFLTLPGDLGNLSIQGTVVWKRWVVTKKTKDPLGFAVEFIHTQSTRPIIEALYTYLRNKQIITVSKRIIEEFFTGPTSKPKFPIEP